jgi:hypothetical protein
MLHSVINTITRMPDSGINSLLLSSSVLNGQRTAPIPVPSLTTPPPADQVCTVSSDHMPILHMSAETSPDLLGNSNIVRDAITALHPSAPVCTPLYSSPAWMQVSHQFPAPSNPPYRGLDTSRRPSARPQSPSPLFPFLPY